MGVVLPDGRIAYAADRIVVDEPFVRAAHEGRPPEQRFRFSSPCMSSACQQWNGHECGLIDRLLIEYERQFGPPPTDDLPDCPIRSDCRWFLQRGGRSCAVCEVLVTDVDLTDPGPPPGSRRPPGEVRRGRPPGCEVDIKGEGTRRCGMLGSTMHVFTPDDRQTLAVIPDFAERIRNYRPSVTPADGWTGVQYDASAEKKMARFRSLLAEIERVYGPVAGSRVLEVGCGDGASTLLLGMQPVSCSIGIDLDLPLFDHSAKGERMCRLIEAVLEKGGFTGPWQDVRCGGSPCNSWSATPADSLSPTAASTSCSRARPWSTSPPSRPPCPKWRGWSAPAA